MIVESPWVNADPKVVVNPTLIGFIRFSIFSKLISLSAFWDVYPVGNTYPTVLGTEFVGTFSPIKKLKLLIPNLSFTLNIPPYDEDIVLDSSFQSILKEFPKFNPWGLSVTTVAIPDAESPYINSVIVVPDPAILNKPFLE